MGCRAYQWSWGIRVTSGGDRGSFGDDKKATVDRGELGVRGGTWEWGRGDGHWREDVGIVMSGNRSVKRPGSSQSRS